VKRTSNFRQPICAICCLAIWLAAAPATCEVAGQSDRRDYEEGPLSSADFTAAIPAETGGKLAYTTTELIYDLTYRYSGRGRRFEVRIESLKVRAVVVRSESWNRSPKNRQLMDHEQGHFDLTYIGALRFRSRFAGVQRPIGTGASLDEAVRNLRDKVDLAMRDSNEQLKQDHRDYDRLTDHGMRLNEQSEHRRLQKAKIEELIESSEGQRKPEQDRDPASRNGGAKP
jgi:hypothetical protein